MYASHLAQSAYAPGSASFKPAREVEYDAFARITAALKSATSTPEKVAALHKNRQLWRILAVDVAEHDNGLPAPLRADIFSLYEFTDQHTDKVIAGSGEIDVLIDINTSIMRGLRGRKDAAA